jgi:Protein of unknown function (DUF1552)
MSLKYSRRNFLTSLGLGAAALPLLEAKDVFGACLATPPKRVVFLVYADGCDGGSKAAYATGSDTSLTLPDWMDLPPEGGTKSLNDWKNELVILDGLHVSQEDVASHEARPVVFNETTLATNDGHMNHVVIAGGASIDQVMAKQLQSQGVQTPRPVLNLGVRNPNGYHASWRAARDPVQPERDPFKLAGQLFAGTGMPKEDPALAVRMKTRQLILGHKLRELDGYKKILGKPDQITIDSWMTSLQELQKELGMPSGGVGCTVPALGASFDVSTTENLPKSIKVQMDLTAFALAADVSRVVMLEIDDSWGDSTFLSWLGTDFTKTGQEDTEHGNNHHHISHENGPRKKEVDRWYHSQLAYFIERLSSIQEGNGSLLDNTLVVWTSDGRNGASHSTSNVPWILAGGKNLGVRRGRYLKQNNPPKQQLLAAVAQLAGAQIKDFGGYAPTAGLT